MADDIDLILREAERLSRTARDLARSRAGATGRDNYEQMQALRASPYASRIPSATPTVQELREAQEILTGPQTLGTGMAVRDAGRGAIDFATRLGNEPFRLLEQAANLANVERATTEGFGANLEAARAVRERDPFSNAPREFFEEIKFPFPGAAGVAADVANPLDPFGPVGAVSFPALLSLARTLGRTGPDSVSDVARVLEGTGRPTNYPAITIYRAEDASGAGPYAPGGLAGRDTFWSTDPGYAARAGANSSRDRMMVVQGQLRFNPDRILSVEDTPTFRANVASGDTVAARADKLIRDAVDNYPIENSIDLENQEKLRSIIRQFDAGEIEASQYLDEFRRFYGEQRTADLFGDNGIDAMIDYAEQGRARHVADQREIIVFNRDSVRQLNIDNPSDLEKALISAGELK